jgi:hypothetical protein
VVFKVSVQDLQPLRCLWSGNRNRIRVLIRVALVAVLCCLVNPRGTGEPTGAGRSHGGSTKTVSISPGNVIQDVVNSNAPGTTFVLGSGVFRMQTIVPKNGDIFIGVPGATLNGSALLTSFWQDIIRGVTYWVAPGPRLPGKMSGICETTHSLCKYPEDFFVDNRPLRRVSRLTDVTTNTCYFDYADAKIYFLANPNGHTVETSVTPTAFEQGANNITIQGLVVEKYASPAQFGAIGDQHAGNGWVIQHNEVRLNHGTGIKVGGSANVIGNYIHDNGQLGLFGRSGALIENNEIARNNWAGFSVTWEAGGAKFGNAQNVIARGNNIHDNVGDGLWCDGACGNGLYENNIVVNNAHNGIAHEISRAWTMRNNVIIANGFGTATHAMHGAGVIVNESDNVEIESNIVANNYKGIILNMSARDDCIINGVPFACDLNSDYVHDNTVVQTHGVAAGLYQGVNNNEYYGRKNNQFVNNVYCLEKSKPSQVYWWLNDYRSQAEWVRYGQDAAGTWACPSVFILSPKNGAVVSGIVTVTAFAADDVGVSALEVYMDGSRVSANTATTYTYPRLSTQAGIGITYIFDTAQLDDVRHTLLVKAYNARGDSSSTAVNVIVKQGNTLR